MSATSITSTARGPDSGARAARTYLVRTLGCQMNRHDSEHLAGMLEQAGYVPATGQDLLDGAADVVVINTCAVRENAAGRLYGISDSSRRSRIAVRACRSLSAGAWPRR